MTIRHRPDPHTCPLRGRCRTSLSCEEYGCLELRGSPVVATNAEVVADLNRVKVLFQQRTLATIIRGGL